MRDILSQSLKILLPPMLGLFLVLFAIWKAYNAQISKAIVDLQIGILTIPMEEGQRKYVLIAILGAALLIFTALRDYSVIMPDKLTLDISFSLEKIELILKKYHNAKEIAGRIPDDWQQRAIALQNRMLDTVTQHAQLKPDYKGRERAFGRGLTTFKVSKNKWSAQSYRIDEVEGLLEISMPILPGAKDQRADFVVKTFSTLRKTDRRIFAVEYLRMLHNWHFFIAPMLRQSFYAGPIKEVTIFDTVALTRVRFFPFIAIEETLYLVAEGDQWIPVAYSIYDQ